MCDIKVGDEVKRIAGTQHGMEIGDTDIVTEVGETCVSLETYGDGHLKSKLKIINSNGACTVGASAPQKTMLKKISAFYKKFTDANTQALVKAGYLNGDLEPTSKARAKVADLAFFSNYDALVAAANEEIAEADAEEAKNN